MIFGLLGFKLNKMLSNREIDIHWSSVMSWFTDRRGIAFVAFALAFTTPALAQVGDSKSPIVAPASASVVAAFKADPVAFLSGIVQGKGDIEATVASIIAADPDVIVVTDAGKPSPMAVASKGLPDQEKAFVRGVADAAKSYVALQKRETFTQIQTAVVSQFDATFQTDFSNAVADVRTAALGSSAGGGGGPINGLQTGGQNSGLFSFSPEVVKNNGPGSPQLGVSALSGSGFTTRTVNSSASPSSVNGL